MSTYPIGFEEDDDMRSSFIRRLTIQEIAGASRLDSKSPTIPDLIPRTIVRYWHDPLDLPHDVQDCLTSWDRLHAAGFEFRMFDDLSAAQYISERYSNRECIAFARCRHPAMRSDYLRMCFVLAEGGLYVDADDVLVSDNWKQIFQDGRLKVQPLCYDVPSATMVPTSQIWRADLPTSGRIFYVNNNPIAAPPNHPVVHRALCRATEKLLASTRPLEIQSTTGPGNFTASLASHANELDSNGRAYDFKLIHDWNSIAETRWQLSYRGDARNWRNMDRSP